MEYLKQAILYLNLLQNVTVFPTKQTDSRGELLNWSISAHQNTLVIFSKLNDTQ